MKKLRISRAVGIVLAALMLLAPTAALATAPPLDPDYKMSVVADLATVTPGQTFTATVMIEAPVDLMSAQFEKFTFDHNVVQIVSVEGAVGAGEPWFGATFFAPTQEKIDEANTDGTLDFPTGGVFWTQPPGPATPGKFVTINMKAKEGITGTHTVALTVSEFYSLNANLEEILDADFEGIPGEVVVEGPPLPMPDLVVTAVSAEWEKVGETYNVTFTIKNEGDAEAAASTAGIEIDGEEKATADVPALAAGETHTATVGPFTLTAGRDTVKVYADKLAVVAEGDETNNYLETTWLLPDHPDLIVSNLEFEWRAVGTYWVSYTIKNQGNAAAVVSTASITIDGHEFTPVVIPVLAAGETHTRPWWPIHVPITLTGDSDTVKVVADRDNVVDESDETNNYLVVVPGGADLPDQPVVPDLVVIPEGWSVEWVEGGQYRVTFTIKNQGEGDAAASTAGIEVDGVEEAAADVPALAAGETHTATAGPFTITNGRDIVKVIADRDNVVAERGGEAANHREWAVEGQKAPWEAPWAIIAGVIGAAVVAGIVIFAVRRRTS
ncbi:cohesin domain-containing protein [Dehalococcoidia bacterium]|nr:cohesin domain-containing protein [Dehalococcoidia bacterium]